jgi:ATP-binding cassette subfamily B protein
MGLAATGVLAVAIPQATQYLRAQIDRAVGVLAQDELYEAVERFGGLTRFEDPAFLSHLRLAQQVAGSAPVQLIDSALGIGRGVVMIGGFAVSLSALNPAMTAAVAIASIPALLAEMHLSRRRAETAWGVSPAERRELFYGQLLGSVEAAKEIRLFGIGSFFRARMLHERRTANAARRRMDRRELLLQSALAVAGAALAGAGLVWAVSAARAGELTIGDVSLFIAAVSGVQAGLSGLVAEISSVHHELLMFGHFMTVVQAPPDLPHPPAPETLPPLRRGIELRDVWFRYSDGHGWALRELNLFVPHGRSVAVVGLNGAGKTTLVKLLCRFYDPTRGAILWDGVDLRDVPVEELRERIAAVFQDFMCYDLTASENVAVGDIDALGALDRIRAAAARAGIDAALSSLPRGYDTLLTRMFSGDDEDGSEIGVILSGGQWQRLALARGFLRERRDLMILDEPTSGLDADAEHEIHTRLQELRGGRTSVLVSHRLSAVRKADVIAVLDRGTVVEQGSHASLIAAEGAYARLFSLQAEGYKDGAPPAAQVPRA